MELVLYIFIILISSFIVYKGGSMLENASEILANHYDLPSVVKGSLIMAVGSSFPELSAVLVSTILHGKFDLGVSAIVGSAIFNIMVIPGVASALYGPQKADHSLVYKDSQFYLTSIVALLLTFSLGAIYYPVADTENIIGNVNRELALIPFLLYGLYVYLQFVDTKEHREKSNGENKERHNSIGKVWLKLVISLVLILVSVEGLVRGALFLGEFFNTPDFFWGITVIAAATSVPDAVVSIKAAQKGDGTAGLSNVLGSNIFDLLVAVPAGVLIAGTASVNITIAVPMMLFLTIATIAFFTLLRYNLVLSRAEGIGMLIGYFLFVIWMLLESFDVISIVLK
ncbi:sodium:calcium antiporter [Mangrovivirga sp. M17]|uniref:Sodium:calcium antiporter n=1 Tax=Mangrovivirga halotolerans TaxID=2993936 RepID=A0ABT3RN21_9BACT|nr:sodium:calcium antiporter [Mangrovivirga halotolerans]MCX2743210.1 sodium:calcium antiporter [Mangrovivirga halotolerans]